LRLHGPGANAARFLATVYACWSHAALARRAAAFLPSAAAVADARTRRLPCHSTRNGRSSLSDHEERFPRLRELRAQSAARRCSRTALGRWGDAMSAAISSPPFAVVIRSFHTSRDTARRRSPDHRPERTRPCAPRAGSTPWPSAERRPPEPKGSPPPAPPTVRISAPAGFLGMSEAPGAPAKDTRTLAGWPAALVRWRDRRRPGKRAGRGGGTEPWRASYSLRGAPELRRPGTRVLAARRGGLGVAVPRLYAGRAYERRRPFVSSITLTGRFSTCRAGQLQARSVRRLVLNG